VSRFWRRRFRIGAERPAYHPRPRPDFTRALAEEVRESRAGRRGLRVAFAGGLTVVMLAALAGFGGLGYAANGGRHAANAVKTVFKAEKSKARSSARGRAAQRETPAENQYRGMRCTILHRKGNGDFVLITVAGEAVPAHMRHGDPPPINCQPR